ncbi:MAG: signal peptidase I, partial [Armatimonadota bacterium]
LQPGDRYLLKKSAYHRRIPRRGDVIVFRDPRDSSLLIKRVVALPGEDVFVFQGQLYKYVNGRWIAQEYAEASPLLEMPQRLTVPDDAVYVLGDNRAMSEDSRDFGPVPLDRIIGQAVYIIWPLDRVGPIR